MAISDIHGRCCLYYTCLKTDCTCCGRYVKIKALAHSSTHLACGGWGFAIILECNMDVMRDKPTGSHNFPQSGLLKLKFTSLASVLSLFSCHSRWCHWWKFFSLLCVWKWSEVDICFLSWHQLTGPLRWQPPQYSCIFWETSKSHQTNIVLHQLTFLWLPLFIRIKVKWAPATADLGEGCWLSSLWCYTLGIYNGRRVSVATWKMSRGRKTLAGPVQCLRSTQFKWPYSCFPAQRWR